MTEQGKQPEAVPVTVPMSIPLKELYTHLCPVCREIVIALITHMAEKGQLHDAIKGRLEAEHD